MIELRGRHFFIVGGSRGIGAGVARLAASFGARVSFTYRSEAGAAEDLVKEIQAKDGQALALKADVQSETEIDAAVDAAVKAFGPLHGMVISAGVFEHMTIEKMTLEFWNRV
ncbi:MAG: SDR family oxidoreductase, partial [Planctomycetota bacterium]|nr:SDR family oxidoreductase [Planctomycetota bacterium]